MKFLCDGRKNVYSPDKSLCRENWLGAFQEITFITCSLLRPYIRTLHFYLAKHAQELEPEAKHDENLELSALTIPLVYFFEERENISLQRVRKIYNLKGVHVKPERNLLTYFTLNDILKYTLWLGGKLINYYFIVL